MRGLRTLGLIAMAIAVAHCGNSDVDVVGGAVDPDPGTFAGTTNNGGIITLIVGSVESATMVCNGQSFGGTCSPTLQVVNGNASGTCNGLFIDVTFNTNNSAQINDASAGTSCDGSGSASRTDSSPGVTPTPAPTNVPTGVPTEVPTEVPTDVPTDVPTTAGTPCPTHLTLEGQGAQAELNTGTTGIAFNQTVIERGTLTVALSNCNPGEPGNCGVCDVTGPVESNTAVNNHRCIGDTSMTCTVDGDCGGSGPCKFTFGSYLPLSSGGVPVCVRNAVEGQVTGSADIEGGTGSSITNLTSQVFTGLETAQPCPVCSGASFLSTGTCTGGARNGMTCTVHGTSALFGNTSFDCPPNPASNIGNLPINLSPTTGTSTLNPTNTCTDFPFTGLDCYCPGQRRPNSCASGLCESLDGDGVGACESGPFVGFCRPTDTFRTCLTSDDCPTGGDTCQFEPQPCHGPQNTDTFEINGPLRRTGAASMTNPVLSAVFCIEAVAASAVNEAAGLPGPGTLRLPSKTCFTDGTATCTF